MSARLADQAPARLPGVAALWPGPAHRLTRRPVRRGSLLLLPRAGAPRMLVPADVGGAHLMLQRHSPGRLQRATQELLVRAQRTGLLGLLPLQRLVPGDDGAGIDEHVRAHVPGATRVGVLLGPPRANAKPVLQVFDARGRTIAFGKLGHEPAVAALVEGEASVLEELGRRRFATVEVPEVLWSGRWCGMALLLMTALSGSQRRASSWEPPMEAMAEVADEPGSVEERLAGGSYVGALRARAAAGPAPLVGVVDRLETAAGTVPLALGRWHGDWAPWNMARVGARVQVWDWERSVTGVPVGLDVLHFQVQREVRRGSTPADAVAAALAALSRAPWRSTDEQRAATLVLYLAEVWARYATGGAAPTPALRHRLAMVEQMADIALHQHWRT